MDQSRCSVDHRSEVSVGLFAAHGYSFEFFEFGEEVLDQVAPLVHNLVELHGVEPPRPLRKDNLCAAGMNFVDDPIGIESLVGQQSIEFDDINQRFDADSIVSMARQ